ncbi:hypothetical protein [Paenibacillus koleovorans]|uniref:hypothetical protein n=1 Tax=Paenibacillus koleovorans TaxID=121608 RepID=UPI000FDA83D6|nr:hypothetical protein [Paenibacillus koleovorans]
MAREATPEPAPRAASRASAAAAAPARASRLMRTALAIAALVALALAALWLLNAAFPAASSTPSHIGNAMQWLRDGRVDLVWAMVVRKLQMNIHLLGVSAWSKVLLAGLLVMLAVVLWPRELRKWQNSHPFLMDGCSAITIGAIAALLLNDSGIVAGGTMIVFAAVPLLLLKLSSDSP